MNEFNELFDDHLFKIDETKDYKIQPDTFPHSHQKILELDLIGPDADEIRREIEEA